jgi:putative ABC transport system permease protein
MPNGTAARRPSGSRSARAPPHCARKFLARALCLALLGAAGAVVVAVWGGQMLDALFTGDIAPAGQPDTTRLLVFTGALGVVAALLAGLLPALRMPRSDVRETLGSGARLAGRTGAARRTLAAVQVALCMVLLVGAGLFVTSFRNALRVDLGFDHDRLIMLRVERDDGVEVPRSRLLADARDRVLRVPSVEAASGTVAVPFTLIYGLSASLPDGEQIQHMTVNAVGEDFFRTMGVPVQRGRALDAGDMGAGAEPVVVVSRRAAEHLWPGRDPLAQCLHVGEDGPCARVVGVAGDHAGASFTVDELAPTNTMQAWVATGFPLAQPWSSLLVRTAAPPASVLAEVRRAASVPGVRYVEAELVGDMVAREMRQWQLGATVFSLFGFIALLVAGVGLHGVLAFEVAQRRREFGIRAALGAGRLRVLLPVLRFAAPVVVAGVLTGAAIALLAAGRLTDLLFEVGPRDPVILAAAAVGVAMVAAIALLVPGWRAATVDPRETLADG